MTTPKQRQSDPKPPSVARALTLGTSLILSALLTATALRNPALNWLAWLSFLPLFVAVRWLRPATAALAGGLWGVCLYLFCTAGPTPEVNALAFAMGPSLGLLALLIVIPAVYVGLAARPARCGTGILPVASAVSLLTLALGWTLIEVVVSLHYPSGPHGGLLSGCQGQGPQLHWLARLLCYVFIAFLVACVNASLVGILSGARLNFPTYLALAGSPNTSGWLPSQGVPAIQSWTLCQARPRAPPTQVAAIR